MSSLYGTSPVPYFIRRGMAGKGLEQHLACHLLYYQLCKSSCPTFPLHNIRDGIYNGTYTHLI